MRSVSFLQIIFVSLLSTSVFAMGGWSSGGGELLKDARNPWFLKNVKEVSYCISVDEQNFGASRFFIERTLAQAIRFWQSEFANAISSGSSSLGNIGIATQVFHQVDCGAQVDIAFQFGKLSEIQKNYLKAPSEYAAISVRTSYSNRDMRGKGFVYLSPIRGSLAYNPEGVIKNAWANDSNNLLYLTLVHELGHVFGLPHMGSYGDLMSEGFVESILMHAKIAGADQADPNFFSLLKKSHVICPQENLLAVWSDFFGMAPTEKCLQFVFDHSPGNQALGETKMKVLSSPTIIGSQKQIAEIDLTMNRFNPTFLSLIWLPKGQALFSQNDLLDARIPDVLGAFLISVSKHGSFIIKGKEKRNLSVRFEQGKQSFSIDGVGNDGEIISIL